MAFLMFERAANNGRRILRPTEEHFRLGGRGLIYRAWEQHQRPTNQGRHVTANELIQLHTSDRETDETRALSIDFDPRATWRIAFIELLDVYAFTYGGGEAGQVVWTLLMLRLRDVLYEERPITRAEKAAIIAEIPEPTCENDFVEFLYLQGDRGSWNWGRNGSTNAAFIQQAAREYFRQFF